MKQASWISNLQAGAHVPAFELTLPRLLLPFHGHIVGVLFLDLVISRWVHSVAPKMVQV